MSSLRFAFYGRLSTTDKQDPALSFPSQLKACQRKAAERGGKVVCEFTDQESGAKQDRPGWSALTHEARDRDTRRFDAVVIYSTSRLARDRLVAALYERELSKVGVSIHYATGAGDPDTPEGVTVHRHATTVGRVRAQQTGSRDQARDARSDRARLPHRRPRTVRIQAGAARAPQRPQGRHQQTPCHARP